MTKTKRNQELAAKFRKMKCIVNNGQCVGHVVGDHIKNFAGKSERDVEFNIWPLCVKHHDEKGRSLARFAEKYNLVDELKRRGFYWCSNKWRHEKLF